MLKSISLENAKFDALQKEYDYLASKLQETENQLKVSNKKLEETENQLKESNKRLKLATDILDELNDGIIVLDKDFHFLYCNAAMKQITKFPRGKSFKSGILPWEVFPQMIAQNTDKFFKIAIKGQILHNIDNSYQFPNGATLFTSETYFPVLNGKGVVCILKNKTEFKKAEEALMETEGINRSILDNSPDIVLMVDQDCKIQFINRSIAGFSTDNIYYENISKFVSPEDYKLMRKRVLQIFKGEDTKRLEIEICDLTQKFKVFQVRFGKIKSNFEVIGVIIILTDITERKKAEEKLKESERRYRLLAENSNEVIWTYDMNLNCSYMSPYVTNLLGYSQEEAIKMNIRDLMTDFSFKKLISVISEELEIEKEGKKDLIRIKNEELECLHKNGFIVNCELKATFLRNNEGKAIGFLGSTRDITKRKQKENKLIESEEKFRELLENTQNIVYKLNLKTMSYDYVSPSVETVLGYTVQEFITSDASKGDISIHPNDYEKAKEYRNKILNSEQDDQKFYSFDMRVRHKNGEYKCFKDQSKLVRDKDGKPLYIVASMTDITDRESAERELKYYLEFEKLIGEISSKFIEKPSQKIDSVIDKALQDLVEFLNCNIGRVHIFNNEITSLNKTFEYCKDQSDTLANRTQKINIQDFSFLSKIFLDLEPFTVSHPEDRPKEAKGIRNWQKQYGFHPFIIIPIATKNKSFGVMMLIGKEGETKNWPERSKSLLKSIANSIAIVIERKKSEQALIDSEKKLRQSEARYRLLVENMTEGLGIQDVEGNHIYANSKFYEITGYSNEELIGSNSIELFDMDGRNKYKERMALRKKGDKTPYEAVFIKKNTERVNVLVSPTPIFEEDTGIFNGSFAVVTDITPLKKIEKALEKERNRAQKYLDIAGSILIALDRNGKVTLINRKGCKMLGYPEEEIIGKEWFDEFLPIDFRKGIMGTFKDLMKGEIELAKYYENSILDRNGNEHLIAWYNTLIIDEKGQINGILSSGEDITDRKRTEKELIESEEKFRGLFDNVTVGFAYHKIILNNDGIPVDYEYIDINPMFTQLTGLTREKTIGKRITEILPGIDSDPAGWIGKYGKVALEGLHITFENYSEHLNKWYLVNAYSPKKGYFVTVFIDVSDRKKSEENLRESEEKYRIISEQSFMGICLFQERKIQYCNNAFSEILGYNSEEIMSWGPGEFIKVIHPDEKELILDLVRQRESGNQNYNPYFQFRLINRKGGFKNISIYSKPINYRGKNAILVTIIDISKRLKLEFELKQHADYLEKALNEKEMLLKELHHRVKNNLQVISAITLMHEESFNDDNRHIFKDYQNRIKAMAEIHEILYSSNVADKIDMKKYVENLVRNLIISYKVDSDRIEIAQKIEDIELSITEVMHYGLILNELISNALKYAFPNNGSGKIEISCKRNENKEIVLVVQDNGIGFPENYNFKNQNTMGMRIVRTSTKQINGKLKLTKCKGTKWVINFKEKFIKRN
jgi:PAS domain S-box-containing protein